MSAEPARAPAPRHPTISDVALALATHRSDPVSTIKIGDANAKGVVQIEVSVSHADPGVAADQAGKLYDVLRAKYPRASGDVGT